MHVTSLYNHVPTKDAVIDEMVNALIAEARLPTGRIGWEDWVRQFAAGMRALGRKHPGAFEAFHHGPATGERAAEPFESGFAAFRSAGFDAALDLQRGQGDRRRRARLRARGHAAGAHGRTRPGPMSASCPIERFPQVHAMNRVAGKTDTFALPGRGAHCRVRGDEEGPRRRRKPVSD